MDDANSLGGFMGIGPGGPKVSAKTANPSLSGLTRQNELYGDASAMEHLRNYGNGSESSDSLLGNYGDSLDGSQMTEFQNALATGPLTGSKFATEQVQKNPILGSLFGQDGELNKSIGKEQELQNQGFELKPEDMTMYGQTSGNIARMFGAQGNQASQDLANRGLASAPSGAAGAMFSGLAGNQNEMLAQAQQNIMQQRFQNTMGQIKQQQNFIGQLGQQGNTAIQDQFGRQLAGANAQKQGMQAGAQLQAGANQGDNKSTMEAEQFNQDNKPLNFMDYATAGLGQGIQAGMGGSAAGMTKMQPLQKPGQKPADPGVAGGGMASSDDWASFTGAP